MNYRFLIIILLAITINSCAIFNYDRSDELVAKEIIGKCYKTTQWTSVIKYGVIGSSYTLYPTTRDIDRGYVKEVKLFEPELQFKVVKVIDQAFGETGRCWSVRIELVNNYLKDEIVDIPSCRFTQNPIWIKEKMPIEIDSTYAVPC
ncbi:hypothetical protein [Kangiella sp. M94]